MMMARSSCLIVGLMTLGGVVGCGGATAETPATDAASTPATAASAGPVATPPPSRRTVTPDPARTISFQLPSKNIFCNGSGRDGGAARCDIVVKSYPLPAELDCSGTEGGGNSGTTLVVLATGPGKWGCPTDSAMWLGAPVLAYGSSRRMGEVSCSSSQLGVKCENADGHGFFMSKTRAYVY